eukprot:m.312169 g.312169  ORF g.312169 m.312169 type:complete len:68 (-) comp15966_c1_seq1:26-229(-)
MQQFHFTSILQNVALLNLCIILVVLTPNPAPTPTFNFILHCMLVQFVWRSAAQTTSRGDLNSSSLAH